MPGPGVAETTWVPALCEALVGSGQKVVHALSDADIDLILMTDPRSFAQCLLRRRRDPAATHIQEPSAIVVHRINECDERKGEGSFINARLVRANYAADVDGLVGEWLRELPLWRHTLPFALVRGSQRLGHADFQPPGLWSWRGEGPLRLVTHRWGYHPMKRNTMSMWPWMT